MRSGSRLLDRCKEFPPVPERNTEILQVLISQMGEYGDVNFILGKTLRVLPKPKSPKPVGNLLHIASGLQVLLKRQYGSLYVLRGECSLFALWVRMPVRAHKPPKPAMLRVPSSI